MSTEWSNFCVQSAQDETEIKHKSLGEFIYFEVVAYGV